MNVAPKSNQTQTVAPSAAKVAKLGELKRRVEASTNSGRGVQRSEPRGRLATAGDQGHQEPQAQNRSATRGRRELARLGDPKRKTVRPAVVGAARDGRLVTGPATSLYNWSLQAAARSIADAHARVRPTAVPSTKIHSRLVPDDEAKVHFAMVGAKYPHGATIYSTDSGPNALSPEADIAMVSMSHGGAAHLAESQKLSLNDDGTMTLHGRELLAPVYFPPDIGSGASAQTSLVPEGAVMALVPTNPRFIDGSRVAQFLAAYDQFCLVNVTFDYVQATNLTQSGQLLLSYINDPDDSITLETGFGAVRDGYSRAGSCLFSVRENARATIGHPLLKWYYTSSDAGGTPSVEIPGYIALFNMLATSSSSGDATPLGTLAMSYEIRVRAPAIHSPVPATHLTTSASLSMAGTYGADQFVQETAAASGLPGNLITPGSINWGTIAAVSDGTLNTPVWRTWYRDGDSSSYALGPGNVLFWRVLPNAAGPIVMFFPTLASALSDTPWSFTESSASSAAARGFKLWNIMGFDIPN